MKQNLVQNRDIQTEILTFNIEVRWRMYRISNVFACLRRAVSEVQPIFNLTRDFLHVVRLCDNVVEDRFPETKAETKVPRSCQVSLLPRKPTHISPIIASMLCRGWVRQQRCSVMVHKIFAHTHMSTCRANPLVFAVTKWSWLFASSSCRAKRRYILPWNSVWSNPAGCSDEFGEGASADPASSATLWGPNTQPTHYMWCRASEDIRGIFLPEAMKKGIVRKGFSVNIRLERDSTTAMKGKCTWTSGWEALCWLLFLSCVSLRETTQGRSKPRDWSPFPTSEGKISSRSILREKALCRHNQAT